jgi:hypothetical protein
MFQKRRLAEVDLALRAGFSRTSAGDCASVMGNGEIELLRQVLAPHMKGKSIQQSAGEPFSSEFLSTHRALGISAFMNVNAKSRSGFGHQFHIATNYQYRVR